MVEREMKGSENLAGQTKNEIWTSVEMRDLRNGERLFSKIQN